MEVGGKAVEIEGRFLRIGRLAEGFAFVEKPQLLLAESVRAGSSMDLFTLIQGLPTTTPACRNTYYQGKNGVAEVPLNTQDLSDISIRNIRLL